MPNVFLSGRIPAELNQKIDEFLASTGETKTEMLAKAVAAYIGAEPPPLKATGDRRIENLEQEVAKLQGAVKSLDEKVAALTPKIENSKVELEAITTYDNKTDNTDNSGQVEDIDKIDYTFTDIENTVDNNNNYVEIDKENTVNNTVDNSNNKAETSTPTGVTPTISDAKTFIKIDTAEAAELTKLNRRQFNNWRSGFNRKLKTKNQSLPERKMLESPIKMTPPSGVKIEKVPYDLFYLGQSKDGTNFWSLVPETIVGEEMPLPFLTDNNG